MADPAAVRTAGGSSGTPQLDKAARSSATVRSSSTHPGHVPRGRACCRRRTCASSMRNSESTYAAESKSSLVKGYMSRYRLRALAISIDDIPLEPRQKHHFLWIAPHMLCTVECQAVWLCAYSMYSVFPELPCSLLHARSQFIQWLSALWTWERLLMCWNIYAVTALDRVTRRGRRTYSAQIAYLVHLFHAVRIWAVCYNHWSPHTTAGQVLALSFKRFAH